MRLRISITGAILISLNVVKIALVLCDCNKRSATRARKRLMGTRCSGRSPKSTLGAATWGKEVAGMPVGIALAATTLGAAAPLATAASTSPLVTRPSLPVPATALALRWLSASNLAAAGIATPAFALLDAATDTGAALAGLALAATEAGAAVAAPATAAVSIRAIN